MHVSHGISANAMIPGIQRCMYLYLSTQLRWWMVAWVEVERMCRNGRVALMNRQSPQRHAAARAAASDAADALREAQSGLSDRFEAVEQKAKESIYAPSDDGMTSGDEDLPEIEEIFVDNYDDKIEKAPDSIVLVDFYTKWYVP